MSDKIRLRREVDEVIDRFCNVITLLGGMRVFDEPLNIESDYLKLDGNGVDVDYKGMFTFEDYVELIRRDCYRSIEQGKEVRIKEITDIINLFEERHGTLYEESCKFEGSIGSEKENLSLIAYRAKNIVDNLFMKLREKYPTRREDRGNRIA